MKILMFGWEFPPEISGGLGMACYGIVSELAKIGVQIKLVLPHSTENTTGSTNVSITGCETIKTTNNYSIIEKFSNYIDLYKVESLLHPYITEKTYLDYLLLNENQKLQQNTGTHPVNLTGKYGPNLVEEVIRYALAASSIAAEDSYDLIHAHDWLTGLAAVEAKKISKKPMLFQVHALEYDRSGENVNQKIFDIEKYVMNEADLIIAVSQYTKEVIIHRYAVPAKKIKVVHNGTFKEKTAPHHTKKNKYHRKMVLFVGRLTYQKGPWYFIEAARKILAINPNIDFVLAGNGDLLKDMIEHVASLRLGSNIHFTGFLSQTMVKKLYQQADVYVMPSVSEPFGLTCLEALTYNIPVVISKQSGVSEVLPHVLKADFWDVDEMAAKILALLNYKVLREESLNHSASDMEPLTWGRTAENLITIYNGFLE